MMSPFLISYLLCIALHCRFFMANIISKIPIW